MTAATCSVQLPLFTEITGDLEDRVPSDGLTLDTLAGPVDLVAVQRALAGEHVELTTAELAYTNTLISQQMTARPARLRLGATTTVVNMRGRRDDPGYADVVYVGRAQYSGGWHLAASPLANPFRIGRDGSATDVLARYEQHIRSRPDLLDLARSLRGRRLGCWCAPEPCHADVIARIADTPEGG